MAAVRMQALTTVAQWLACAHDGTSLLPAGADPNGVGVVAVAAAVASDHSSVPVAVAGDLAPAGLAISAACLAYHAVPETGRLDQLRWDPSAGRSDATGDPVLAAPDEAPAGDFAATSAQRDTLAATSLALDPSAPDGSRLVAVDETGEIVALDLGQRRVVRRIRLVAPPAPSAPWTAPLTPAPLVPVDLASAGDGVLVACRSRAHPLWQLRWHGEPVEIPIAARSLVGLPAGALPARVCADPDGRAWLLWQAPGAPAWVTPVADDRSTAAFGPLPGATDIEFDGAGRLVVAGAAGADLRVFALIAGAWSEDRPLRARRADGRGITRAPDGRIAFWTAAGMRVAHAAPQRYGTGGTVITAALDGGMFRQRWGRLYLDACIPPGTAVTVGYLTSDDLPGDEFDELPVPLGESLTVPATPPVNVSGPVARAGLPLPVTDAPARFGPELPLYRRGAVEQPWLRRAADDAFVTYEAPVNAPPGRYLWLRLRLSATGLRTPRVRAVRVETSSPRLLERLPRVYSEEPASAAFLDRYLKLLDVQLADLAAAADARDVLLDPRSAPPQLLPWLGSLVGLVLDPRWSEAARRSMIAQAVPLFRRRGTIGALLTMMQIVLGVEPVLVERYAFRGLTGSVGHAVLRAGASFEQYAHRFSVVIPGAPSNDQLDVIHDLLAVHRPAHTLFEVCSARTGSRIGIGLHLGLTSVIGRSSGWSGLRVGGVVGRDGILGRPEVALRVGAGELGATSRVEP